jgi:hypothetical protein
MNPTTPKPPQTPAQKFKDFDQKSGAIDNAVDNTMYAGLDKKLGLAAGTSKARFGPAPAEEGDDGTS